MLKETFRKIEYSNPQRFENINGKIQLKEYSEDLQFLLDFSNSFNARYGVGGIEPVSIEGEPTLADWSPLGFGKHIKMNDGVIIYDNSNFENINKEGSIQFFLKSEFNNAKGYQSFKNKNPKDIEESGVYYFRLYLSGSYVGEYNIEVTPTDTRDDIWNKIDLVIPSANFNTSIIDERISIIANKNGDYVEIKNSEDSARKSLKNLFGGVREYVIPNGPQNDVTFMTLRDSNGINKNKINFKHTSDGSIVLEMYDKNGDLTIEENLGVWSNDYLKWYYFELSFNSQVGHFYINGSLKKVFMTEEIDRDEINTYLILRGDGEGSSHAFSEIRVFDEFQNYNKYEIPTSTFTPYDNTNPYGDVYYGVGFREEEIKDIIISSSEELRFSIKNGNNWYYYFNNGWRVGNGDFSTSTSKEIFETEFANLFFDENFELVIRIFFDSDGWEQRYLDEISIIKEESTDSAAKIISQIQVLDTVNLSEDASVIITTDKGELEVNLASESLDVFNVTLEEIILSIKNANVPGLDKVLDDGEGRLILIAETQGSESYISIDDTDSDSALSIIWGESSSDIGESNYISDFKQDYDELYRYVRSRLGAPLVPVELTNEQIDDCLSEVIFEYDRWRNFEESLEIVTLSGNPKSGWDLPPMIGSPKNITEIIVRPRYPAGYYTGRNDIMENIYIQHIFNKGQIMNNVADHHISLVANNDLNIIMDTTITWEIINKKLYLKPHPPGNSLEVGIKYKSILTLDEILNNQQIKNLLVALAKITLGTIRSTFGNQVPGGDGMLQLNGSELKSEGTQEKQEIIQDWQKSTNVYEFIIG